jgi:FAD synthase
MLNRWLNADCKVYGTGFKLGNKRKKEINQMFSKNRFIVTHENLAEMRADDFAKIVIREYIESGQIAYETLPPANN